MTVHPRRAVMELYHLKRVHILLPNDRLAEAMKHKLSALNILPSQLTEHSLESLLDTLAYFKLPHVPAAKVAVAHAHAILPTLKGKWLARVVGACSRLEEHSVALQSAPLLKDAISSMTPDDVVTLAAAFRNAGLASPERWALLIEHVMRNIRHFCADGLATLVDIVAQQRVEYPDFYAVVERHVSDQPASYIDAATLSRLTESFRRANAPVMSLLALSTERTALGVDSGLDVVAGGLRANNDALVQTFLASSKRQLETAPLEAVLETLVLCEEKRVFHLEVLSAACRRVLVLRGEEPLEARSSRAAQYFAFVQSALHVTTGVQRLSPSSAHGDPWVALGAQLWHILDSCVPVVASEPIRSVAALAMIIQLFSFASSTDSASTSLFAKEVVESFLRCDTLEVMESVHVLRFAEVMRALAPLGGLDVLKKHLPVIMMGRSRLKAFQLCRLMDVISHIPRTPSPSSPPSVAAAVASAGTSVPADLIGTSLLELCECLTEIRGWRSTVDCKDALLLLRSMARIQVRHTGVLLEVVGILLQQHGAFSCEELSTAAVHLAQLQFKEFDFFSATASRVFMHPQCTVSDVCRMLYSLTFVVAYPTRVVQEALPRLRIAAARATPRDCALALYSFVKLRVTKHEDITRALCDHAAVTVDHFRLKELLSVCQSLKQLGAAHRPLFEAVAQRLRREHLSSTTIMRNEASLRLEGDSPFLSGLVAALLSSDGGSEYVSSDVLHRFVASRAARLEAMGVTEFKDTLAAFGRIKKHQDSRLVRENGCPSVNQAQCLVAGVELNVNLLRSIAEKRVNEFTDVPTLCDVVLGLTDLVRDAIPCDSALADRLRRCAMEFMELPHYQDAFRACGLFRLFPHVEAPSPEAAKGTVAASLSPGIAPASAFVALQSKTAPNSPDAPAANVGERLRQFHYAGKDKRSLVKKRRGR